MKAYNQKAQYVIFFRPRCKMWGCPACAQINARLWAARAHHGASSYVELGRRLHFLTLTSHEKLDASATLEVWPHAWKKLHTRAVREGGKQAYLMIPERHKDGRLHMHALTTWNLGSRWWKDNARECGLGFMAEEEEARTPGGAASYVTKYISKTLADTMWPPGWRRVRTSRDWPQLPELAKPEGWRFSTLEKQDRLMSEVIRHALWEENVYVLDHVTAWEAIEAIDAGGVFAYD